MYGMDFLRQNSAIAGIWAILCVCMSLFTLLPTVNVENIELMYVSVLWINAREADLLDYSAAF
jgi:phosphatidylinositol glycan class N